MTADPATPPTSLAEREPVALATLIVAALTALIAVATAFGLSLSAEQTVAIIGAAEAVLALVAVIWTRRRVTSPATMRQIIDRSGIQPPVAPPPPAS